MTSGRAAEQVERLWRDHLARRAEEMTSQWPIIGPIAVAEEVDEYDPTDGPEVSPLAEAREAAKETPEAARFDAIIRTEDTAVSAWNPVTGLEPVLCRVCGEASDPRRGKVLTHRDTYPCAPVVELPREDGRTSQVRDLVLLKSANMREEVGPARTELQPWEVLEISVRAYQATSIISPAVPSGPVRECVYCLSVADLPSMTVTHAPWSRCAGSDGHTVTVLDPAVVTVAAVHLPGTRHVTDPAWYHLAAGWWVALENTDPPAWGEDYHESVELSTVALWAAAPDDLTPVPLSKSDRDQAGVLSGRMSRMAGYFRLLDRTVTVYGIAPLIQAIATAMEQSWSALEGLHAEDGGTLLHAAVGNPQECPICPARLPSPRGLVDPALASLARQIHAELLADWGRNLDLRTVEVILSFLISCGARERTQLDEDGNTDSYRLISDVTGAVNRHFLVSRDERDRGQGQVAAADVSRVLFGYSSYVARGGPL